MYLLTLMVISSSSSSSAITIIETFSHGCARCRLEHAIFTESLAHLRPSDFHSRREILREVCMCVSVAICALMRVGEEGYWNSHLEIVTIIIALQLHCWLILIVLMIASPLLFLSLSFLYR